MSFPKEPFETGLTPEEKDRTLASVTAFKRAGFRASRAMATAADAKHPLETRRAALGEALAALDEEDAHFAQYTDQICEAFTRIGRDENRDVSETLEGIQKSRETQAKRTESERASLAGLRQVL